MFQIGVILTYNWYFTLDITSTVVEFPDVFKNKSDMSLPCDGIAKRNVNNFDDTVISLPLTWIQTQSRKSPVYLFKKYDIRKIVTSSSYVLMYVYDIDRIIRLHHLPSTNHRLHVQVDQSQNRDLGKEITRYVQGFDAHWSAWTKADSIGQSRLGTLMAVMWLFFSPKKCSLVCVFKKRASFQKDE